MQVILYLNFQHMLMFIEKLEDRFKVTLTQ